VFIYLCLYLCCYLCYAIIYPSDGSPYPSDVFIYPSDERPYPSDGPTYPWPFPDLGVSSNSHQYDADYARTKSSYQSP
jgi:hypothetical protein